MNPGGLLSYPVSPVLCPHHPAGLTFMNKATAEALIRKLGLDVLPVEGGHFRQTYRADETVAVARPGMDSPLLKPRSTAILYLLSADPDSFSAMHGLPADEIYHFYLGDPVELLLLGPDGGSEVVTLGHDLLNGQHVQFAVAAGVWQGSRLVPGAGSPCWAQPWRRVLSRKTTFPETGTRWLSNTPTGPG